MGGLLLKPLATTRKQKAKDPVNRTHSVAATTVANKILCIPNHFAVSRREWYRPGLRDA